MFEHFSLQKLEAYSERKLSPDEFIVIDKHLDECEACYQTFQEISGLGDESSQLKFDLSPDEEDFHLTYEDHFEPYVDGQTDEVEREIIESHLEICEECSDRLQDLLKFKENVDELNRAESVDSPIALEDKPTKATPFAFLKTPVQWRIALAALFIFCAAIAAVLIVQRQFNANQNVTQNANTDSPSLQANGNGATQQPPDNANKTIKLDKTTQPQITDTLNDGGKQITLNSNGDIKGLESVPPYYRQAVAVALTTQRLEMPKALAALFLKPDALRGEEAFALESPVSKIVRSNQPTFHWQTLEGAVSYNVEIFDATSGQLVISSPPLLTTEWKVSTPLLRGVSYKWQVTAQKDGKKIIASDNSASGAKFRVIDDKSLADLQQAEKLSVNSRLLRGLAYAKAGLVDEAEMEFKALAIANPNSSVAKKLLERVRLVKAGKP